MGLLATLQALITGVSIEPLPPRDKARIISIEWEQTQTRTMQFIVPARMFRTSGERRALVTVGEPFEMPPDVTFE